MKHFAILSAILSVVLWATHGNALATAGPALCGPSIMLALCANIPAAPTNVEVNTATVGTTQKVRKIGVDSTIQIDMTGTSTQGIALWAAFNSIPLHQQRWPDDRTGQWHAYDDTTKTGAPNASNVGGGCVNPLCGNPALLCGASCTPTPVCLTSYDPNSGAATGFDKFMTQAVAGSEQVNLSANYGSNWDCTGPGDPNEAAGLVAYCQATYTGNCQNITIGTEVYNCTAKQGLVPPNGFLCRDEHGACSPNPAGQCTVIGALGGDPATYGAAFGTWQTAITTAAPGTNVLALAAPQKPASSWDTPVTGALAGAVPQGIEMECYPESTSGTTTDFYALNTAPTNCDDSTVTTGPTTASTVGTAVSRWSGLNGNKIYMDQWALVSGNPSPQSQSIVAALYYAIQEMQFQLDPDVLQATYHTGFGATCQNNNYTAGIYGWQNVPPVPPSVNSNAFGSADSWSIFKTGVCPNYLTAYGTAMAGADSMQVVSAAIHNGEHMLGTTSGNSNILAYAATHTTGHSILLINKSQTVSYNVNLSVDGQLTGTGGTTLLYDKAMYDASGPPICINGFVGCWNSETPVSASFGAWTGSILLVLPAWSEMEVEVN